MNQGASRGEFRDGGSGYGAGSVQRSLAALLSPLSWIYGAAVVARRSWWAGRSHPLACPVISVGNVTCGGTGKTPTVEMIARDLLQLGWRPAILSRGYRSRSRASESDSVDRPAITVLQYVLNQFVCMGGFFNGGQSFPFAANDILVCCPHVFCFFIAAFEFWNG